MIVIRVMAIVSSSAIDIGRPVIWARGRPYINVGSAHVVAVAGIDIAPVDIPGVSRSCFPGCRLFVDVSVR